MHGDAQTNPRKILILVIPLSAAILLCAAFPFFWYSKAAPAQGYFWFNERTNVAGWSYEPVAVSEAAERVLVADRIINGEFTTTNQTAVRVFSAKRYKENPNEIGLFVHTPDRCWTQAGWSIEPAAPDFLELDVHNTRVPLERRIFTGQGHRELVYFCGLTGGQPLPYRLDHNLGVAMRYHLDKQREKTGSALRASDKTLWTRVWESFTSRRQLLGPKQFLRISTAINGSEVQAADNLLQKFLSQWLNPTDYQQELAAWGRHQ
jgi:hypothetical protein